ncbi:MAG: SsrA-binding protein SmpB [Clostridiales bacterium]|nr:SsrA-binding protein SmpB [Clostridiales bacterium]
MEDKIITVNRQAKHEYFIEESIEAGIVLEGTEVKSIRLGSVNLKDSFCLISGSAVYLKNAHIAVYEKSGGFNSRDAKRDRKLLLHKQEIFRLKGKMSEKGYALIPLKMYFSGALIKIELGLCKGKHTFDKKQTLKEKDLMRKADREIKEYR